MTATVNKGMSSSENDIPKSERFARKVLDASLNGIYVYDVTLGRNIFINPQYTKITGYTIDDLNKLSKTQFLDLFHPEDRGLVTEHMEKLFLTGDEDLEIEYRFKTKDDRWIWCLSRDSVFSGDQFESVSHFVGTFLDITGRKESELALRESETRYRELVQHANSAIIRWRCDGSITFFNEYAQSYFGYSAEEVIGRNVSILLPQRDSEGDDLTGLVQDIVDKPQYYIKNINENVCRDGRRVWMAWTNKAIMDQSGKVVEILAIGSDMTEQKRTEESLRHRTAILEGINRIFQEALTCQSEEELGSVCLTVAEEVTSSQCGFIGKLTDESRMDDIAISDPGSICKMAIPNGHRNVHIGLAIHGIPTRVLKDGKGLYTNNSLSHPDSIGLPEGHPPLESFLGAPLNHAGKTIGMVGVANRAGGYRDEDFNSLGMLTPAFVQALLSKRAEQALRESEEKFSKAFYSSPIFLFICELETGIFIEVNDAYCALLGYTREEMIDHSSLELGIISPENRSEILQRFIKTGRVQNMELKIVTKTGGIKLCLFSAETMEYRNKLCLVYSGFDITDRKLAEEINREYQRKLELEVRNRTAEIEKQYRELEKLNQFIKKLSQHTIKAMENDRKGLSKEIHDSIGGSLAAIKMLLESRLLRNNRLPPDGFMSLEKIIGHLNEVIEESRRISYQMRPLALEDFSFEKAISETVKRHEDFYPKIEVSLKVDVSDDGIHEEIKTVLYRVIQEALNNIGKHSGADFAKIEVVESKDSIHLKVEDNGCGFDVSKTIDTEQPLQGYGMRSMKERVEIYKGTFQVESEQGKGTVILVSMPKYVTVKKLHWQRSRAGNRRIVRKND
jgi:PAS domain S-box-containing protein